MNQISYLVILVIVQACFSQQTPPVFPDQYELAFNQSASLGPLSGNTTGKIYLDAKNNKQTITRQNGHHDRYCGSVYKFSDTPCVHRVVQGKRFLDFPDKRYCCFCCDSSHGCGITAPNWLVTANATYQGTENLDSQGPYMKWLIKGLQSNLYYHKNDTLNTPRRLNQLSDDLMDFTSYKVGISDPKIFELPSYCKDQCGLTTICAGLRNDNLQTE